MKWWKDIRLLFFIFYSGEYPSFSVLFKLYIFHFLPFSPNEKWRNGNGMMKGCKIMIWIFIIFCSVEYPSFSVFFKLYTFNFLSFQIIKIEKWQMLNILHFESFQSVVYSFSAFFTQLAMRSKDDGTLSKIALKLKM